MMKSVEALLLRDESMRRQADVWRPYWQELAEVYDPHAAVIDRQAEAGTPRGEELYDGTPRLALRDLISALDGLMKPKNMNWFFPSLDDEEMMEDPEVRVALAMIQDRMFKSIYNPQARFIEKSAEVDNMLGVYGGGTLFIDENRSRSGLRFRAFPFSQCRWGDSGSGDVDILAFDRMLTPAQAVNEFGLENIGRKTRETFENQQKSSSPDSPKKCRFVQMVLPNEDFLAKKIGLQGFSYQSSLIDVDSEHEISKSGYHEFPGATPRWTTAPGEIYPRSVGMLALPDAQTLQEMGKTLLIGGQRAVDPPSWVLNDAVMSPVRTYPGGLTIFDSQALGQSNRDPMGVLRTGENIPLGREMQNDTRAQIERAFFRHVISLQTEGRHNVTATEILEQRQDFIRLLGPVFGRLENDYVGRIAYRVFGILKRAGAFNDLPEEVVDGPLMFEFHSPVQQARKAVSVAGVSRVLEVLGPVMTAKPQLLDNFDWDAIARDATEWASIPQEWLSKPEVVKASRDAAEQQAQQEQILAATQPVAGALKDVAQASQAMGAV